MSTVSHKAAAGSMSSGAAQLEIAATVAFALPKRQGSNFKKIHALGAARTPPRRLTNPYAKAQIPRTTYNMKLSSKSSCAIADWAEKKKSDFAVWKQKLSFILLEYGKKRKEIS